METIFNLVFGLVLLTDAALGQKFSNIDPNGVYNYQGKTYKKGGETYGYFGTIKVFRLDSSKILMSFYVCRGAPSYNSGSFVDTLNYINNEAVYVGDTESGQPACQVIFHFEQNGISAEMNAKDPNFGCGFGQGVDAQGYYRRKKRTIPAKEEILKDVDQ